MGPPLVVFDHRSLMGTYVYYRYIVHYVVQYCCYHETIAIINIEQYVSHKYLLQMMYLCSLLVHVQCIKTPQTTTIKEEEAVWPRCSCRLGGKTSSLTHFIHFQRESASNLERVPMFFWPDLFIFRWQHCLELGFMA